MSAEGRAGRGIVKEDKGKAGRGGGAARVAASSYLNTAPLVWSFARGPRRGEIELITDTAPARCADMLARGQAEAALVPVIEYQRLPETALVPGVCVGAREHTGLGFVFAMWMAHESAGERVRGIDFAGARDEGLAHVEEIAIEYERELGRPRAELVRYLRRNICFELDEEMSAGLELYFRLAHKHGVIKSLRPLRWLGTPAA